MVRVRVGQTCWSRRHGCTSWLAYELEWYELKRVRLRIDGIRQSSFNEHLQNVVDSSISAISVSDCS